MVSTSDGVSSFDVFVSLRLAVVRSKILLLAIKGIKVVIALGIHLFPFRTEKLSPTTSMVLRKSGRVDSRRFEKVGRTYPGLRRKADPVLGRLFLLGMVFVGRYNITLTFSFNMYYPAEGRYAERWRVFPQNIGPHLSIDETSLSREHRGYLTVPMCRGLLWMPYRKSA